MARIKVGSLFFIGLFIFIASLFLLIWNECNYVNSVKIANFAQKEAIEVNSNYISSANENKVVQISGKIYSNQILSDGIVNISDAVALFRDIETYQWQESKDENNENKYYYNKVWSKKIINSDKFDNNSYIHPKHLKYSSKKIFADNIKVGKYYLTPDIINKIKYAKKMQQLPYNQKFAIYNGFYFTGNNYDNPAIGDQKLFYSYIPSGIQVSIIANQSGNHLEQIKSPYGDFAIVASGQKNLKQMLKEYRKNINSNTWIFRSIGILLMFIGVNLVIQSITNLNEKIPFLGEIVQSLFFLYTIILTISFSTIAISVCWLPLNPEFATLSILISMFLIFSLKKKKKIVIEG